MSCCRKASPLRKRSARLASRRSRASRWRKEFGGLKSDQVKRLKEFENERLRKAVSNLTLEKLILREAARGNF